MIVDIAEQQEEKILNNLVELHTMICKDPANTHAVIELTKFLSKLLKKRGKKCQQFFTENNC